MGWPCTAQQFWPCYLRSPCVLWIYLWTALLHFCLPVITSSVFILDLQRSLSRKPPAVTMPGRYHSCCLTPSGVQTKRSGLVSEARPDLQPPALPPEAGSGSVMLAYPPAITQTLPESWAVTGIEFFSYRTDSFSLIFLDFLNIRQQCTMTHISLT